MENEGNCDSDSSSELPELFTKREFDIEKLKKNQIVWAEFKGLHWPALVRNVDKKNRKVRLWYLDSPGKLFKVPYRKIGDFSDAEFNEKVHTAAKSSPVGQRHHQVFRRSLIFIHRRSRGIDDDPAEFFDTSKPYFLLKDFVSQSSESKDSSQVSKEKASTEKVSDVDDGLEGSSEGESLAESDEESNQNAKSFPFYKEESPYDDEMEDKILSRITDGHVDQHLLKVWNSEIISERHDLYVEAMKTSNIKLLSDSPSYIPINNNEKLHNVSLYLHKLYEQKIGKGKPKMNEYIISVWLPEAVDKAITLVESDSGNCDASNDPGNDKLSSSLDVAGSSKLPFDPAKKLSSAISTEVKAFKAETESLRNLKESPAQELEEQVIAGAVEEAESADASTGSNRPAIKLTIPLSKITSKKKRKRQSRFVASKKKPAIQKSKQENLVTSSVPENASVKKRSARLRRK